MDKKMSKRTSNVIYSGQLEGAKLEIEAVHNHGLRESVTILNRGTVVQPLSGWVLASLRGQVFYPFPDDFMLHPEMIVVVYSGQAKAENIDNGQSNRQELFWTTDQVWNNHADTAILFDADGLEVHRYSYPFERVTWSRANRRKVLISHEGSFEIIDESLLRPKIITRK
jgi:hypothetical protein